MMRRSLTAALLLSAATGALLSGGARANPQGGQVSAGSATITQTSPSRVDVRQSSQRAVVDWRSFSIAPGEQTNFQQPGTTAIILNRVNGGDPSQILGKLTANGQVVIVNPSGILFGAGAQVDVGGLIATTTNISNANFMAGRMTFDQPSASPSATVVNQGSISVQEGGLVALVAPGVANNGVINARLGKVSLVSANSFTVDLYGDRLISIAVDDAVARKMIGPDGQPLAAAVENTGRIVADGGTVQISAKTAKGLLDNVINMSGVVQARSVNQVAGEIVLDGGPSGVVNLTGKLDARGVEAGQTGGRVTVLGEKIGVMAGATVDASGTAGGGTVQIGGSQQGQGPLPNATAVYVDAQATIAADATDRGNGGKVVVWSDSYTRFDGTARARGGANGGDGGFVETSSKGTLVANGRGDAAAPQGKAGTWLLDPYDVTITNTTSNGSFGGDTFTPTGNGSTVSAASINTQLNAGSNVVIQTNSSGGNSTGSLTVAAAIDKSAGTDSTLSLISTGGNGTGVTIAAPITNSGGGRLGLRLIGEDIAVNGTVNIRGDLFVTAGASMTQTAALSVGGNSAVFAGTGSITLNHTGNAFGGTVSLNTAGSGNAQLTNSIATNLWVTSVGGNLSITSGGSITQQNAVTVAGTTTLALSNPGTDITLANLANPLVIGGNLANVRDLSLSNTDMSSVTGALGAYTGLRNLTLYAPTTAVALSGFNASGNVSVTASGAVTQTGAISVAGTAFFGSGVGSAPGQAITLTNAGNRFTGAVTLSNPNATAGAQLTNSIATVLAGSWVGGNLTVASGGTISQISGVPIRVDGTTTLSVSAPGSDILLDHGRNLFNGAMTVGGTAANVRDLSIGNFSATGSVPVLSGLTNLRNLDLEFYASGVNLSGFNASGTVYVVSGGSITQTGAISVAGASQFNAGYHTDATIPAPSSAITLTDAANRFAGNVRLSNGGAGGPVDLVQLTNSIATDLGSSTVGNWSVVSGGSITLSGGGNLGVYGNTTLAVTAANSDIRLDGLPNTLTGSITFGGTTSNIRDVSIRNVAATASTPDVSGLTNLRNLAIQHDQAGVALGAVHATGNVNIIAGGAITQTGAAIVAGTSSFATAAGMIDLSQAGNRFTGAVTLASPADARLTNGMATVLGASTVSGALSVVSAGIITQTGALTIGGASRFDAGANAIALTQGGNRLGGAVSFATAGANDVQLVNGAATTLGASTIGGALDVTSDGAITQSGGLTVVGASRFAAGANAIDLSNESNQLTGAVTVSTSGGAAVRLTNAAPLTLAASTVGGDLTLRADALGGSGAVSLAGALTLVPLTAGTDIRLGGSGNFAGLDFNDAQRARFSGYTSLTLGAANGTGRLVVATPQSFAPDVSVTLQAGGAGGRVAVANALTLTGSGGLTLTAGANVDISGTIQLGSGGLTVNGPTTLDPAITTAGGAIAFNGALTLTASAALITNAGGAAGAAIRIAGPLEGAGQSLSLSAGTGDILFSGSVGAGGALGSITVVSARDVTAQTTVVTGQFTQQQGTGTTDFRGGGLTVGVGDFTGNRFLGTYKADSLTINSNQTVAFGTVGGVSGPAAAALIRSNGSTASQTFNGVPFGATGAGGIPSGAAATALFVQVGTNGALDAVRTAGIGTVLPKSAGGDGQINLETEGANGN